MATQNRLLEPINDTYTQINKMMQYRIYLFYGCTIQRFRLKKDHLQKETNQTYPICTCRLLTGLGSRMDANNNPLACMGLRGITTYK